MFGKPKEQVNLPKIAHFFCLGCGKKIGAQYGDSHDDKLLRKTLDGKCPYCGRQLNKKSVLLPGVTKRLLKQSKHKGLPTWPS